MSSSSVSSPSPVVMDLDPVEFSHVHRTLVRREKCAERLPKIFFTIYFVSALTLTVLCLTVWRSTLLSFGSSPANPSSSHSSSSSAFDSLATHSNADEENQAADFELLYNNCANSNDNVCSNSAGTWCCASSQSCGSTFGSCNSNVGLIVGIIIAIWVGPLAIYLLIIALIRCSQVGRFQGLANSGRFQSWVIISGCFQMSIDSSSGDADFNQVSYSLVNAYGGCGDECVMHCIGIWCFGFCYPCCMCCVSAGRNQTKVGTLQNALAGRGYNTNVQFLSSVIPACCNSVFIGLISRTQSGVMVVASPGYGQQVVYAQPVPGSPIAYAQPVQYQQPQAQYPGQPQYLPQPQYAQVPSPQIGYQPQYAPQQMYGQPPMQQQAPAYSPVAGTDVISSGKTTAVPPEVVKPQG